MASRAKPTRSSARTTRSTRKRAPETIDLSAKEVKDSSPEGKDAKPSAADAKATGTKSTAKAAASKSSEGKASAKTEPKPAAQSSKPFGGDKPSTQTSTGQPQFGRNVGSKPSTTSTSEKPDPLATARSSSDRGFGFGALLGSAVLGGLVTIGGLGALGSTPDSGKLPLVGSLFQGQTQNDGGNGVSSQFEELQSRLEQLETAGAPTGPDPEIETRLQSIESSLQELSQQSGTGSVSAETAGKLAELERQVSELGAALAASAENSNPQNTDPQLAATLAELSDRLSTIENAEPTDLSSTIEQLGDRLSKATGVTDELAATTDANAQVLAELAARTQQIEASIASVKTSEKVARSVAANLLGSALESGENLNVPIASLEALYGQSEETSRLTELSQEGIPSREDLISEFEAFRDQVEAQTAAPQAEAGDGFLNRLLISAKSLVKVRPAGPVEGDDASAILSRIRHQLDQGDLVKVNEEWQNLPQEMQEAGSGWIAQVKTRQEAVALFESLSSRMAAE